MIELVKRERTHADVVAFDSSGSPALIVEVKTRPVSADAERLSLVRPHLAGYLARTPFLMLIDSERASIYRASDDKRWNRVAEFDARPIFEAYYPEFARKQVREGYAIALVEAWLRDLGVHWKLEHPPGEFDVDRVGLGELLRDAETRSEWSAGGPSSSSSNEDF